jgi:chromosomal replication initiator protein
MAPPERSHRHAQQQVSLTNHKGEEAHAMLRLLLGEDIYELWLASMRFENFHGRVVRTSVPAKFLRNWIQAHFSDELLECYAAEFPDVERVDIVLRERYSRERISPPKNS